MKRILIIIGTQFWLVLALFLLVRLAFLGMYRESFSGIPFKDIVVAFIHGIRFDVSVITASFGVLNLCFLIPGRFKHHEYFLRFTAIVGYGLVVGMLAIHLIDLVNFQYIGRRMSFEFITFVSSLDDFRAMLRIALIEKKLALLLTVILIVLLGWVWFRCWAILIAIPKPTRRTKAWIATTSVIAYWFVAVILYRGGFQGHVLTTDMAFRDARLMLGQLTLNAPFTVMKELDRGGTRFQMIRWIPENEARFRVQKMLGLSENVEFPNDSYVFLRQPTDHRSTRADRPDYNVVIIILESWSSMYIHPLGGNNPDSTPFFNTLSNKGRLYDRFFSNGSRSAEGLAAILASVANLPDIKVFSSAFEQNALFSIGAFFRDKRFSTLFIHGTWEGSQGIHDFARRIGFQKALAKEDFENHKLIWDGFWGIWDEYQFDKLKEEFDASTEPFLGVVYTATSHEPFILPDKKFEHYDASTPDHEWLNTLRYSDYALGKFFNEAEKSPWFERTLFVITADHALSGWSDQLINSSRIPLLLYSAADLIEPGLDHTVGSHVDIVPTILDVLKIDGPYSSTGTSMVNKIPESEFALFCSGSTIVWYANEFVYQFAKDRLLGVFNYIEDPLMTNPIKKTDTPIHQRNARNYLAYYQSVHNAMLMNRVSPP